MREIKFRAYDKKIRKFSNFIINCKNSIEFMDDNTCGWYGENHERYKDFELMQYTGLKDRNGKEIYEGDIVKTHFLENLETIGDIRFYGGTFVIVDSDYPNKHLSWYEKIFEYVGNEKDIEVVGNIYEDPELLEGDDE